MKARIEKSESTYKEERAFKSTVFAKKANENVAQIIANRIETQFKVGKSEFKSSFKSTIPS